MPNQDVEVLTGYANDLSIKYHNATHINTDVAPIVEMVSPKMKFATYNRGPQYQSGAALRKPGTRIEKTKVERDSVSANTEQYAASDSITREDLRDANLPVYLRPPIDLAQDSIEKNAKDLDLGRELRLATHIFNETWADGNAGGKDMAGAWLTPSTSTFLVDFDVGINTLVKNGADPKMLRLWLDWGTMQALKRIDDLREQMKYTTSKSIMASMLAGILEIPTVIIGSSIKNTAQAAAGTDAFTGKYIWEKTPTKGSAMLYAYEKPGRKTLNAIVQPRSKLDNKQPRITESYWDPKAKEWVYDSMEETDIISTATPAGYLWIDTILT